MGFVNDNLMPGEDITYQTKLTGVVYKIPLIIAALSFFLIFFISASPLPFIVIIALLWGVATFLEYKTSEFAVTNKRVLIKVGILKINSLETLLAKIEGIQVTQSVLGRLLNYGTITITGTGGTRNPFAKIDAPFEFRRRVQEQIEYHQDRTLVSVQPATRHASST